MPTLTRSAITVVVFTCSVLTILSFTGQRVLAQTVQHRQTDLDFTSSLQSQSASLQKQVRGLDVRLKNLEQTAAATEHILLGRQIQPPASTSDGVSNVTTASAERRVPETLRHKDRAVDQADLGAIRNELRTLTRQIQVEQDRLGTIQAQQTRSIEANLQQLQQQVRALDVKLGNAERAIKQ